MRRWFGTWLGDGFPSIRFDLTLAEVMAELDPGSTERAIEASPRLI